MFVLVTYSYSERDKVDYHNRVIAPGLAVPLQPQDPWSRFERFVWGSNPGKIEDTAPR